MNPYLQSFAETLLLRYPVDAKSMSYSDWLCENTHDPRNPGKKFSLKGFEFQRAILDDTHQDMVCVKPSQVGISEIQLRKSLAFLVRNRGTSLIFTLPTLDMQKRMSRTRVKPLITQEKVFQGLEGERPVASMDLYQIGNSFLYMVGANEGAATSIPADVIVTDELDLSDQRMVGLFQSRLQASQWRITQRFSTPTHAGYGVDALYSASDQHSYTHRCSACGHWQVPLFHLNHLHLEGYVGEGDLMLLDEEGLASIDLSASFVKCTRCHKPLDLLNPDLWEWVSKHPGRSSRGYRVRPFCTSSLALDYVLKQLVRRKSMEDTKGFVNTVLGEPYSDGDSKLTEEAIRRCFKNPSVPEVGKMTPVAVGIDVGQTAHLVLGAIRGDVVHPFYFELIPADNLPTRVEELSKIYNIVCGAADRHPYTPTVNEIRKVTNGKVLPTEYRGQRLINLVKDEFEDLSHAQVNRTAVIDRVVKLVQTGSLEINGYGQYSELITTHLMNMVRVETPEKEATWVKLNTADHFFHALALLEISPRIKEVVYSNFAETNLTQVGFINISHGAKQKPEPTLFGRGRPMADIGLF